MSVNNNPQITEPFPVRLPEKQSGGCCHKISSALSSVWTAIKTFFLWIASAFCCGSKTSAIAADRPSESIPVNTSTPPPQSSPSLRDRVTRTPPASSSPTIQHISPISTPVLPSPQLPSSASNAAPSSPQRPSTPPAEAIQTPVASAQPSMESSRSATPSPVTSPRSTTESSTPEELPSTSQLVQPVLAETITSLDALKEARKILFPNLEDLKAALGTVTLPPNPRHAAHQTEVFIQRMKGLITNLESGKIQFTLNCENHEFSFILTHPTQVDSIVEFVKEQIRDFPGEIAEESVFDDQVNAVMTSVVAQISSQPSFIQQLISEIVALLPRCPDRAEEIFNYAESETGQDLRLLRFMATTVYADSINRKITLLNALSNQLPENYPHLDAMRTIYSEFKNGFVTNYQFKRDNEEDRLLELQLRSALETLAEKLGCVAPDFEMEMNTSEDPSYAAALQEEENTTSTIDDASFAAALQAEVDATVVSDVSTIQAEEGQRFAQSLQGQDPQIAAAMLQSRFTDIALQIQILSLLPTPFANQVGQHLNQA